MNQGTFSDYHDRSGDGESSYWPNLGGPSVWSPYSNLGIFYMNDSAKNLAHELSGSRLSWFSTLTTCKIIIVLQLLRPRIDWLMSLVAILIRIL